MRRVVFGIGIMLFTVYLWAQKVNTHPVSDTTDLSDMSLEDLSEMRSRHAESDLEKNINMPVEAASRKPLALRRSPSVVTVITADMIERSGARDLMDVLVLVPGLEFNVDVEGVVALSFRGLWSNEGNISLRIDGQEMNEIAYASLQFGNHYALSRIKKVEVLRGPGSAIYGGCAEYAVINIITRKGKDIKGVEANLLSSQTAETYIRQAASVAVGNNVKGLNYAVFAHTARGQRSNRSYTDVYGTGYDMVGHARLNEDCIDLNASYKGFSAHFNYDNYSTTNRDGDLSTMSKAYPLDFVTYMSSLRYDKSWGRRLKLQVVLAHKYAEPWRFTGQPEPVDSDYYSYRLKANTYRFTSSLSWDPLYWINVNGGLVAYNDRGLLTGGNVFRTDNTDHVSYMNYAPFVQLLLRRSFATVTLGARYDISTAFGKAFNPRLGVTKKLGVFNFKLLYASSFRAPAIESIQYGIDGNKLKPETSHTLELEASARINKNMYLSVNLFDITTTNAIRYFVKVDTPVIGYDDGYLNSNKIIGSQGIEYDFRYISDLGLISAAYSFYTIANKNVDMANAVPVSSSATLGTAQHKFSILASVNISKKVYVSPSFNLLGRRYAYTSVDSTGDGVLTLLEPQAILNLFVGCRNVLPNFSGGIGVANITNEEVLYPQAYSSYHAPLPGAGREYYLRLSYRLPFK